MMILLRAAVEHRGTKVIPNTRWNCRSLCVCREERAVSAEY